MNFSRNAKYFIHSHRIMVQVRRNFWRWCGCTSFSEKGCCKAGCSGPCLNTSSNGDPPIPCLLSTLSLDSCRLALWTPFTCFFLRKRKLSLLNIPLYITCSTPVILLAFHWTHSRISIPSLSHRAQSWAQQSQGRLPTTELKEILAFLWSTAHRLHKCWTPPQCCSASGVYRWILFKLLDASPFAPSQVLPCKFSAKLLRKKRVCPHLKCYTGFFFPDAGFCIC